MIINKRLKNIFQINVSSTRKLFIVVIVIHVIQITYNYKREVDGEEGSNDDTHAYTFIYLLPQSIALSNGLRKC